MKTVSPVHLSLLGTSILALSAHAQIALLPGVQYPAVERPSGVASADFNGDQRDDLAVTVDNPDRLLIMFNNGDGTFAAPVSYLLGANTGGGSLVAADMDGNGTIDLAVALQNQSQVRIFTNSGTGVFTAGPMLPVGQNPRGMLAVDLTGNARLDLVVANRDSDTVSVLLNQGNLIFTSASYPVGQEPRDVAAGDISGNGRPDLVITNHDDRTISVLHNNGFGAFTPAQTLSVGGNVRPEGVVAGDFDGDTRIDFAVASSGGGGHFAAIFRNIGGSLSGPINYPVGGIDPGAIAAADLDGNGTVDLITANEGSNNISILAGAGNGTFALAQMYATGVNPSSIALGRFDANLSLDIAVTNRDSNNISVFLNQNTGGEPCYANCDNSTLPPILNVDDFTCFINQYAEGQSLTHQQQISHYANCDGSSLVPVLNVDDFTCFINAFAAGCP